MKIFNHDFRASDSKIHVMLKKANLTGHGYKKEVVTKVVQEAEGGKEFQEAHYYYKDVNCSEMQVVEQELERLLPGVIGKDIGNKFKAEVGTRHLDSMGQCRVGLEVHFKEAEGCYNNQTDVSKRRMKRECGSKVCVFCVKIIIKDSGNNNKINNNNNNNKTQQQKQIQQKQKQKQKQQKQKTNKKSKQRSRRRGINWGSSSRRRSSTWGSSSRRRSSTSGSSSRRRRSSSSSSRRRSSSGW